MKNLSRHMLVIILLAFCLALQPAPVGAAEPQGAELARILDSTRLVEDPGERMVSLSGHFLGRPYLAGTLVGGPLEQERLVTDLGGFDCFTLLDVVEALRRSSVAEDFPRQLRLVRYRQGDVDYASRRHFFSDWPVDSPALIADVTREIGRDRVRATVKALNRRSDGTLWLPAVAVVEREIAYIPAAAIGTTVLDALRSGDYVGIYSDRDGLDVSHVGLVVRSDGQLLLRHASSRPGVERVLDEELSRYLQGKPGLVVYRVKP